VSKRATEQRSAGVARWNQAQGGEASSETLGERESVGWELRSDGASADVAVLNPATGLVVGRAEHNTWTILRCD
jgi:hypothetical protein